MKIKIKGIYHERAEDAPFIGALICADNCNYNCQDCCNHELKYSSSYYMEDYQIINEILSNPFNKGIILAGLEWTLQPYEMFRLIELALQNNLEVILYTGMTKEEILNKFPQLNNINMYIKCGRYIKESQIADYKCYGVKLASSNQEIIRCGEI